MSLNRQEQLAPLVDMLQQGRTGSDSEEITISSNYMIPGIEIDRAAEISSNCCRWPSDALSAGLTSPKTCGIRARLLGIAWTRGRREGSIKTARSKSMIMARRISGHHSTFGLRKSVCATLFACKPRTERRTSRPRSFPVASKTPAPSKLSPAHERNIMYTTRTRRS